MIDESCHVEEITSGTRVVLDMGDHQVLFGSTEIPVMAWRPKDGEWKEISEWVEGVEETREIVLTTYEGAHALGIPTEKLSGVEKAINHPIIRALKMGSNYLDKFSNCKGPELKCHLAASSYLVMKFATDALGAAVVMSALAPPAWLSTPAGQLAIVSGGILLQTQSHVVGEFAYQATMAGYDFVTRNTPSTIEQSPVSASASSHHPPTTPSFFPILNPKHKPMTRSVPEDTSSSREPVVEESLDDLTQSFENKIAALNMEMQKRLSRGETEDTLFQDTVESLAQVTSMASGIARLTNNPQLACQISAVGGGMVQGAQLVSSLMAGAINPLAAFGSLISIAGSLSSAFGSSGPNPSEAIMKGLEMLSKQLSDISQRMEKQFQEVFHRLKLQDQMILMTFSSLSIQSEHILDQLKQLKQDMEDGFIGTRTLLLCLENQMQDLKRQLDRMENHQQVQPLEALLFECMQFSDEEPQKFVERVQRLETYLFHFLEQPVFTEQGSPSEFSINLLGKQFGLDPIPHPTLFCSAALALVYSTLIQYPNIFVENCCQNISVIDMKRLQKVFETGHRMKEWFVRLGDPSLFQAFEDEYQEKANCVREAFVKRMVGERKIETRRRKEQRNLEMQKMLVDPDTIQRFQSQLQEGKITFTNHGCWFQGRFKEYSKRKIHSTGNAHWPVANTQRNNYTSFMKTIVQKQVQKYVDDLRSLCSAISHDTVNQERLIPPFLIPKNPAHPILPSYPLKRVIDRDFVGDFQYEIDPEGYMVIEQHRSCSPGQPLILECVFRTRLDFKFYCGNEAIWWGWCGGCFPQTLDTTELYFWTQEQNPLEHWINYPIIPSEPVIPDHEFQREEAPGTTRIQEILRKQSIKKEQLCTRRTLDKLLCDPSLNPVFEFLSYFETILRTYQIITKTEDPDQLVITKKFLQDQRDAKTCFVDINVKMIVRSTDLFSANEGIPPLLDTVLILYQHVLEFYEQGSIVEHNYWYVDESEKKAMVHQSIRSLIAALSYMPPGNVEAFLEKEVVPWTRQLSLTARSVILEDEEISRSCASIGDVLRRAILPSQR